MNKSKLDDLKTGEKTNITRWAVHILDALPEDDVRKLNTLLSEVLDEAEA